MKWLDKYKKDLVALERARLGTLPVDLSKAEELEKIAKELNDIVSPLAGKKIDSQALDFIAGRWWNHWKAAEISSVKKEIKLHLRLMPLYKKLNTRGAAEISEFSRLLLRLRLESPLFKKLIEDYLNRPLDGNPSAAR
jgi:hypothetical protein